MADLSPAARAAFCAWEDEWCRQEGFYEQRALAAALRALADHQRVTGVCNGPLEWWDPNDRTRRELRNLAEELESTGENN